MLQSLLAVIVAVGSYKLARYLQALFRLVDQIAVVQQGNQFQNAQEVPDPIWIPVEKGVIPSWLSGIMYRVGPGKYNLDGKVMIKHAFDGLPFMHRFELSPERQAVRYNARNLATSLERQLVQERAKSAVLFGHVMETTLWERCMAPVKRFKQVFCANDRQDPSSASVGVTATPNYPMPPDWLNRSKETLGEYHLVSKSDINLLQQVHANTLEPKRLYTYASYDKRLSGDLSAAHHQYDPVTQEIFNISIKFGAIPKLTVFSINRSGQVSILAEITHRLLPGGARSRIRPSYIHSFMLTQGHVIIPEYPLYYHGADILLTGNAIGSYAWDEESPTYFHIISRRQDIGHMITLPADSFFSFHNCNAWDTVDENGNPGIILDTCAFDDADIIQQLHTFGTFLRRRPSHPVKTATQTRPKGMSMPPIRQPSFGDLRRYKLTWKRGLEEGTASYTTIAYNIEFARFSQHYALKPNQFAWGCQLLSPKTGKEAERYILVKIDLETGTTVAYSQPRHSCSEPIFVPKSATGSEDEGAVISLVNVVGEHGPEEDSSFLLILDAASMEEIARCPVGPYTISTFHGSYINSNFESVSMN